MQSPFLKDQILNTPLADAAADLKSSTHEDDKSETMPFEFKTQFFGDMEIYSDAECFAEYLNAHEVWFKKCAQPMKVESLGKDGYILTVGRFGAFGYEVEPKMGVILHPPSNQVYPMESIPVPGYTPPGYDVDYKATMTLNEVPAHKASVDIKHFFKHKSPQSIPTKVTLVTWQLSLVVKVKFPKFIYKLPGSIIQKTGDRLLSQIVRQISPQLTYKVQKDFHSKFDLPIPPKSSRNLQKVGDCSDSQE